MTGLVGAVVEAWGELRVHRLRVLLSLVGVAVAVAAMTGVTAIGEITGQAQAEMMEKQGGRPATLRVDVWSEAAPTDPGAVTRAMREVVDRYEIEHASLTMYTMLLMRFPSGTWEVPTQVVDPELGTMRRLTTVQGAWFSDDDAERFAPALVVNEAFLRELGRADLATQPAAVTIGGETPVTATVIGVVPDMWEGTMPEAYILHAAYDRWATGTAVDGFAPQPALEVWIGPEDADIGQEVIARDLRAMLGGGAQVEVYRSDFSGMEEFDQAFRLIVTGVGGLVLLLGALSLVNIALVTVRQRIREIGIRRSFGATSSRVFFSIMMESVVATVLAGLIGVGVAVAVVQNVPLDALLGWGGVQDRPPFPLSAAVTGLVAATAVGALAGLLPALVAVRVRPIDAIRY